MNTFVTAIKSRTVWTVVVMFLIGGVHSVSSLIPQWAVEPALGFLGLLAVYFKLNPSQNYNG